MQNVSSKDLILDSTTLIDYSNFDSSKARDEIISILQEFDKKRMALSDEFADFTKKTPTWQSVIEPLNQLSNRLEKQFAPIRHLNAVMNSDKIRQDYELLNAKITEFFTQIGQDSNLFRLYKEIAKNTDLSEAQQKALALEIQSFELSGVGLDKDKKLEFANLAKRLEELENKFSNNLLDATQAYFLHIEKSEQIVSLPEYLQESSANLAKSKGKKGWLIGLDFPTYLAFMTHCDQRDLREKLYKAYITRASNLAENTKFDNAPLMLEILQIRQKQAKLLGFKNYAEVSTSKKMAKNPARVMEFLQDLAQKSKAKAKLEFKQLCDFAEQEFGFSDLKPWDLTFFSEKLKEKVYQINEEELRAWLPLAKVKQGLFDLVEKLFAVKVVKAQTSIWHKDVEFYNLVENDRIIAGVYFDLFARTGKRSGAWMDESAIRMRLEDGSLQAPVAFLTGNFTPPQTGKSALLTPNEVTTLMHEFGHSLQHNLTKEEVAQVSGIRGIPWDAVELPSQFMENFFYEAEILPSMTAHIDTGEPLPKDKLESLVAAKNFQSAMQMVRQLEFALLDFKLHSQDLTKVEEIEQIIAEVRDSVSVIPSVEYNRFANSFAHIFAGGYSAGYYSYKWAELLSADAFSAFEEEGLLNEQTGLRFKKCFLEPGGTKDVDSSFMEFRGRDANADALLRHNDIDF